MTRRFEGKRALVSGAATGMGRATALRLAEEGAQLILFGLGGDDLDAAARACGGVAVHGDVTKAADIEAAISACNGKLDVLVNVAGIIAIEDPLSVTDASWDKSFAVNTTGIMRMCRAALPLLRQSGKGAIVNYASVAACNSSPTTTSYAASKAAVVALTDSIAHAFGPDGVRANCIAPGWVRTPMSEEEMRLAAAENGTSVEEEFDALTRRIALRRIADPEEIAACCAFLASEDASFVTGTMLIADGGGRTPSKSRVPGAD